MAATMKDIAKHTGYSLGTISNYFTGNASVSEEKCCRIEEAIKDLDYKVNYAARMLRSNNFNCIGVLIPDFGNTYLLRVVSYIESILYEKGYDMLVLSYHETLEKEKDLLQYLTQRVDGILYVPNTNDIGEFVAEIQKVTPIVTFNEMLEGVACDSVLVDNMRIVASTIHVLCEKGHRRIGLIAGPSDAYTTQQRLKGYREACVDNGLVLDDTLIARGDYSKTSGELMCEKLLDTHADITALFVSGYRMTLGALSVINQRKLQNKIAVIGYDAADIEGIFSMPISYFYQPYDQVAKVAVDLVLKRVQGDFTTFPETINLHGEVINLDKVPVI